MLERMVVGKRYLYFYMRLPYKRYIAATSNLDARLSAVIVEWEILIISVQKFLGITHTTTLVSLILYYFQMS